MSNSSQVTFSSETLSHRCWNFFSNGPVRSLQEAVAITTEQLSTHNNANFRFEITDLLGDISDAPNTQVAWQLTFVNRNLDWKKFRYTWYNDLLKVPNSSGRWREMITLYHSAQQRKTWATKNLGDLWQCYSELQEILTDASGSEMWMRLTTIANQTTRILWLAKRCLNRAYVSRLTKLHRKLKPNPSGVFQEAKKLLDSGCRQL